MFDRFLTLCMAELNANPITSDWPTENMTCDYEYLNKQKHTSQLRCCLRKHNLT